MKVVTIVIIVVLLGILIWWFTSDNATAPVVGGSIQYNRGASSFSKFFFKLDCTLVRDGSYNAEDVACQLE